MPIPFKALTFLITSCSVHFPLIYLAFRKVNQNSCVLPLLTLWQAAAASELIEGSAISFFWNVINRCFMRHSFLSAAVESNLCQCLKRQLPENENCHHLLSFMSFQTCMPSFLLWNTKGKFLENILDNLFNIMKVNAIRSCQAPKGLKIIKVAHMTLIRFRFGDDRIVALKICFL